MKDKMGGFGGLIKGLDNLMPQDSEEAVAGMPKQRAFTAKNTNKTLQELRAREHELYAQVGRMAVEKNGPDGFGEVSQQLRQVIEQIQDQERKIREAEEAKMRQQQASQGIPCPNCGAPNAPGVNFCQQCGTKLSAPNKIICPKCGQESLPDTKFCGTCGTKLGG